MFYPQLRELKGEGAPRPATVPPGRESSLWPSNAESSDNGRYGKWSTLMDVAFTRQKLGKTFNSEKALRREFGDRMARVIAMRMAFLKNARTLSLVCARASFRSRQSAVVPQSGAWSFQNVGESPRSPSCFTVRVQIPIIPSR